MIAQMGWGRIAGGAKTSLKSLRGRLRLFGSAVKRDVYLWYASRGTLFSRRFQAKEPGIDRNRVFPGTGTGGPCPSSFPRALRAGALPGSGMHPFQGNGTSSRVLPSLCSKQQG